LIHCLAGEILTRPAVPSAVPYIVMGEGQPELVKPMNKVPTTNVGIKAVRQNAPQMHPGDRARAGSMVNIRERSINTVMRDKPKMQGKRLEPKGNAVGTRTVVILVMDKRIVVSDTAGGQSEPNLPYGSRETW